MKRHVISLLVLVALASQAFAGNFNWSGKDPNSNAINLTTNYWTYGHDEDDDGVPDGDDAVKLDNGWQPECVVDETVDLEVNQLFINETKGPAGANPPIHLNITGGRLSVIGLFRMAGGSGGGDIKISGGILQPKGWFEIGFNSPSTIDITGGEIICGSKVFLGHNNNAAAHAIINIDGGTFRITAADRLDFRPLANNDNVINISDGALVISGNQIAAITPFITDGKIVSTRPDFALEVTYDEDNDETVITATSSLLKAQKPIPANMVTELDYTAGILGWTEGTQADKHDVYVGFNYDQVEAADMSSDMYLGRVDPNQIDFDPVMGRTYYWRVDEVNVDGTEIWAGDIWSFTTIGYFVVDDFETYSGEVGYQVFESWHDGIGYSEPVVVPGNGTGSRVGYENDSNSINLNNYGQTMPLTYDNSGADGKAFYSEISKTFETPQDFTREEIQAIAFYFSGGPDNDVESVYMIIEDSTGNQHQVNYGGADEDIAFGPIPDWDKGFEFNADLGEVQAAGVDISAVKKIFIGIGDKDAIEAGGSGLVFIDDVRLYPPRCVWDYTDDGSDQQYMQTGDFNRDCIVDMYDTLILLDQWLDAEHTLTSTAPGAELVHYTFDDHTSVDGSAADVVDVSGNGFDMVNVDPNLAIPTTGGYSNGFVEFNADYKLSIPNAAFETITNQFTVAFWVRLPQPISEYQNVMWVMKNAEWGDQAIRVNVDPTSTIRLFSGSYNGENDGVTYLYTRNDADPQWVHYAMTKNVDEATSIIYENGIPVAYNYNSDTVIDGPGIAAAVNDSATLGGLPGADWGMFTGQIDEFYMYDYALSNEEVMYMAGVDEAVIPLPDGNADINEDKIINLGDFAEMASEWLSIEVWPVPLY